MHGLFARLKKRFDEILSEGQGLQLVLLLLLIVIVIALFWLLSSFLFGKGTLSWQELVALLLDPGTFGGGLGKHDVFRLFVTLSGVLLFSALLISVIGNIFDNIADSFRKGRIRYDQKDHVLILGSGSHLFGMLSELLKKDSPYGDSEIVVLTNRNVENLKEQVFSLPFLDKEMTQALRRRLTVYAGERDNENDLTQKGLAQKAKVIYVIGEDEEANADAVSFRCCEALRGICGNEGEPLRCFVMLRDPSSIKVFKYQGKPDPSNRLKIDMVDVNEYLAERVLIPKEQSYPPVDYTISRDGEGHIVRSVGVTPDSETTVHLVIAGMTDTGRAMALTAAHICHFPNYREKGIRTVISFVDTDMTQSMHRFLAEHANLFELSHHRYVAFDETGEARVSAKVPNPEFGDFLDIEWEFYDADIRDPHMRKQIGHWTADDRQSLSFFLCLDRPKDNTQAALNLPKPVYENRYPVFVHMEEDGVILEEARKTGQFGDIRIFGSTQGAAVDPLFVRRSVEGQRVNYSYSGKPADSSPVAEWFTLKETDKLSSIYSANGMVILNHNFQLMDRDLSALTEEQWIPICEEEHRRWMVSNLLLGYSALEETRRKQWEAKATQDYQQAKQEKKALKDTAFLHYNLAPFDELPVPDQALDRYIIQEIRYVLLGE